MLRIALQIDRALLSLADRVPGAVERTLNVVMDVVQAESTKQMARIPAVEPARSRTTGRHLWEQTGALAASRERMEQPGERQLLWTSDYAAARFGLWHSRIPAHPADGTVRDNNVPQETMDNLADSLPELAVRALAEALDIG